MSDNIGTKFAHVGNLIFNRAYGNYVFLVIEAPPDSVATVIAVKSGGGGGREVRAAPGDRVIA